MKLLRIVLILSAIIAALGLVYDPIRSWFHAPERWT